MGTPDVGDIFGCFIRFSTWQYVYRVRIRGGVYLVYKIYKYVERR